MNSVYNFNLYINEQLLKKTTFSGSLEWPSYTDFTINDVHR